MMINKMFTTAPQNFGQTRNYSTNVPPRKLMEDTMKVYLAKNSTPTNAYLNNFQGASSNKTFDNLKPQTPNGKIYQSCSNFINKSNSYPNNLRKEHMQNEETSGSQLPTQTLGVYPNNFRREVDFAVGSGFKVEGGKVETPKSISWDIFNQESPSEMFSRFFIGVVTNGKVDAKNQNSDKTDKPNHKKINPEKGHKDTISDSNTCKEYPTQQRKSYSKSKHSESFPPMEYHLSKSENSKTKKLQPKRTKDPQKRKKHRQVWHKSLDLDTDFDLEIEIGIDAFDFHDSPEPPQRNPTLEEFVKTTPIQCQPQASCFFPISISPICILNDPVYFSVSPPRPTILQNNRKEFVFRKRLPSDCRSEDSFNIIFEDGDTSCCLEESEESSDDTDYSGMYSDDDGVDFVDGSCNSCTMDDIFRKKVSKKRVRFDEKVTVHPMVAWAYAYKASRKGHWEECCRDRERFKKRIEDSGRTLDRILESQHRDRIYQERFLSQQNDSIHTQ